MAVAISIDLQINSCSNFHCLPPFLRGDGGIFNCKLIPGNLYVADTYNHRLQVAEKQSNEVCLNVPTYPGTDVFVQPIDSTTEDTPVTITFEKVTGEGTTGVTTSEIGPPPLLGFKLGTPPVYYEIATTATYEGSIEICIDYHGIAYDNELLLKLFHYEGDAWVDITSFLDTSNDIICGLASSLSPFAVFEENIAPVIGEIGAAVDPVSVDTLVTAWASFTDLNTSDTHTATWDWGDGTITGGVITEADGSGSAEGSHSYTTPGIYTVSLIVTDNDAGVGTLDYRYVVVYDPEGGFVTGGGWINSPAGAYRDNPSLTGKATFGFVSKYKKGANVPTGATEFHFRVAKFNFQSESYQWLVIAGAKAQYKGTGTVNGEEGYGFLLTAVDGELKGDGLDRLRMKIWEVDPVSEVETVMYDNELGQADDREAATGLGGGSIVIHK